MSEKQKTPLSGTSASDTRFIPKVEVKGLSSLRKVIGSQDVRRLIPVIVITSLMTNLLALALPLGMLQIFDRILKNESVDTLVVLTLGILLMILLEELLKSINTTVTNWLGARFKHRASMQVLNKFFQIPMRLFSKEEPGAYAEKMQTVSKVADVYSGSALLILLDLPFIVIFLGVIWLIAGKLVLVPIALMSVFSVLVVIFGRWMYRQIINRDLNDERRISFLTEVLAGVLSVKTMSVESIMQRRYERLKESSATQGEQLFFGNNFASNLGNVMSQIMIVLVIFFGALLVLGGDISSGALAACMMLSVRALQPLRRGLSTWMRYQAFIAGDQRLTSVLSMPGRHELGLTELQQVEREISLHNVSFGEAHGEHGDQLLFENLNLTVSKGRCIAIRGDSGSGKSTLLALMNGLEDPDSGQALVDGVPITQYLSASVRQKIALLPQEGSVFVGSILDNLTMFEPSREERALSLSEELGLDQIVAGMKQGYQTPLGENASEILPMGVRQLIAIVRALAYDPEVILFDEANSALDFEGDKLLRQYLQSRKGELTMVLVANRPSMVKLADEIFRIEDGHLKEDDGEFIFSRHSADDDGVEKPEQDERLDSVIRTRVFNDSDLSRCLLPLLTHMGWTGNCREFAQALPHLADHIDLSYFFGAMVNLGFKARFYSNSFRGFDQRLLPCIFMPKSEPAVAVLEALPDGNYRVFNSATDQEELWTELPKGKGDIYIFQPLEQDVDHKRPWVRELFWKFRKHLSLVFVVTLLTTLLAIAPSLFVRTVFDSVLPTADAEMGTYLLVGVLLAISIGWFLNTLRGRLLAYIGGRIEYVLGSAIFERVLRLPTSSLNGVSVSRQISRIKSLERLRDLFLGPLVLIAFDLPASLILLIAIFLINPWAGGVMLCSIVAFSILLLTTRAMSDRASELSSDAAGKKTELIDESLGRMRGLRALGAQTVWMGRFRNLSGTAAHAGFKEQQVQLRITAFSHLIASFSGLAVLSTSAYMVIQGEITGGTIMATMILTWRLLSPMQGLFTALTSWSRVSKNIFQVNQLMKLAQESDGSNLEANRFINQGTLDFNRVSFRYASHLDPVLLGITFKVPPGKILGITGPDGAGKSSLLSLISRLHYPQAGSIRIDSIDTRQIAADYLRSIISYMPQKCDIFYGTVAQNLRLVHAAATDEELYWALEMAGLSKDVERMDRGIHTRISNSSADQMSNGFRQRLSLARTVLKPASIVLLDEPGNGMDDAGEEALMRCINWLRGRVTLILVTPRPSHLKVADHILYMENGTITARGSYADVEGKIMAGLS